MYVVMVQCNRSRQRGIVNDFFFYLVLSDQLRDLTQQFSQNPESEMICHQSHQNRHVLTNHISQDNLSESNACG